MSDIQVTSVDGNQINVTTGVVVGPLPSLQLAAGTGITIASGGGVSTISANLSELSIPANLSDLADVTANATAGQLLSYNGTSWAAITVSVPTNLSDLADVAANATAGQLLSYNGTSWAAITVSVPTNLSDLADVAANATAGQLLSYNGTSWEATTVSVPAGTTVNGLSGDVTLLAGSNINLSADGQNITIGTVGAASISAITDLTDVNASMTPVSGQALVWDGTEWTADAVTALVSNGTNLDLGTGKILYSNIYQTLDDLPDAANYHGMFAHVHDADGLGTGAAFYAHAGNWVRLADNDDVPTTFVSGLNGLTGSIILAGGSNVQIGQSGNQLTISSTQTFSTLNGESGSLSLVGGDGIAVSTVDNIITVAATNHTSVNNITGSVGIIAGDNINVATSGQNVVISGQSGGVSWGNPPTDPGDPGNPGDVAYDDNYLYVHTSQGWRRAALGSWNPTITLTIQPQDLSLELGQSGNFTVAATVSDGSSPSYQWQTSDDNGSTWGTVTGANTTTYSLSGVSIADNGTQYRAVVSAPGAVDVTSSVATLSVTETFRLLIANGDTLLTEAGETLNHDGVYANSISITQQPQNTTASGGAASFSVAATVSDGSNATYQWQEFSSGNWSDISGETAGTLNLTGLTLGDDGGQYRAVASAAGAANVTSDSATLTVPIVEFSQQPQNTTVVAGNDATFSATLAPADNWYVYDMKWERADSGSPNSWSVVETEDIANYDISNSPAVTQNYTWPSAGSFDDGDLFRATGAAFEQELVLTSATLQADSIYATGSQSLKYEDLGNSGLTESYFWSAGSSGTLQIEYNLGSDGASQSSAYTIKKNGSVIETFTPSESLHPGGTTASGQNLSVSQGDQVSLEVLASGYPQPYKQGFAIKFTPTAGLQTQNVTSATATLTVT